MIKRTLFFGNPAYLSMRNAQLVVKQTDAQTQEEVVKTVPIEDIGVVVLEDRQITITNGAMDALLQNNCAWRGRRDCRRKGCALSLTILV